MVLLSITPVVRSADAQSVSLSLRSVRGADSVRIGKSQPPTVIAVFATWCRSCKDEVATFNALSRELAPKGVRFVALSADEIGDARLVGWLDRYNVSYPVVRDTTGAALRALSVVGVPEVHIVDATGRVVWKHRGPIEAKLMQLRAHIERMRH
jgi:peroxiredoxin